MQWPIPSKPYHCFHPTIGSYLNFYSHCSSYQIPNKMMMFMVDGWITICCFNNYLNLNGMMLGLYHSDDCLKLLNPTKIAWHPYFSWLNQVRSVFWLATPMKSITGTAFALPRLTRQRDTAWGRARISNLPRQNLNWKDLPMTRARMTKINGPRPRMTKSTIVEQMEVEVVGSWEWFHGHYGW